MPASETRATMSPRSIRWASSVARGPSLPSWLEISGGAGRMPSLSSRPPVRRGVSPGVPAAPAGGVAAPRLGAAVPVDRRAGGKTRAKPRVGLALGGDAPLASESRPRRQRLDATPSRAVALAGRTVRLDHRVAELGPGAGGTAVDLAVQDQ